MDIIKITIPLSDQDLDKYFDTIDQFKFIVDYDNSTYKNKLFLNYIYNSGMDCDLEFQEPNQEIAQLMLAYIQYKKQFSIPVLNALWNDVIAHYIEEKGVNDDEQYTLFLASFVEDNRALLAELIEVLFCLKLHLANIIIYDCAKFEDCEEKTYRLLGENFIAIRNDSKFWLNMAVFDTLGLPVYNYANFEELSFEGKKISHYFLHEFSPFTMLMQLKSESEEAVCR